MDYEKMYNEALKRAKKFEEKYGGGYAEYIFPELAESEDERIRIELKEAFEAYDIESKWNGIPIRSIFAWLEKQKEQKPAEWDELQTEFRSINEAFEDGKKEVIEHPEKYGLQKPAEWSEDTIRKAVKEAGLTQHQIDWFKNNVFPPKPEWSEEDEAMRDNILRLLSCFVGTLECDSNPSLSTSYPAYQREMDWLKSLRPSWKPSEEQMKVFDGLYHNYILDKNDYKVLESLYEQLKKL